MSILFLRSIGFQTKAKVVKKKFDMKEQIETIERSEWRELLNHIYSYHNDDAGNYKNNVKKAILRYEETEEYSIKLVRNNVPLMFGKTSTLFFSGDITENLMKLSTAIKDGHLDGVIKTHYLSVGRKKKAASKARAIRAIDQEERKRRE